MSRLRSPAKVNIGLSIVGRRADGFHVLESVFWPLSFADDIQFEEAEVTSLEMGWTSDAPIPSTGLPEASDNLAMKAWAGVPKAPAQKITIEKRIPTGGGLGGGSSNAGTVLRHLVAGGFVDKHEAQRMAPQLGADVPFFLDPKPSFVSGIGEKIESLSIPEKGMGQLWFAIVFLPRPIVTAEVFKRFRESGKTFSPERGKVEGLNDIFRLAKNDLEPVAIQQYPLIQEAITMLKSTECLFAGMSGSGSSCYAIYASQQQQEKSSKAVHQWCRLYEGRVLYTQTFLGE